MISCITLFGPTASGKSALALALAQSLNAEIINADSRQVYQNIPLIAACPSAADYQTVPHHLYEFLPLTQAYSAGAWAEAARQKIAEVQSRGKLPLVVGGTGFYLKSLIHDGHAAAPPISPELAQTLQQRLATEGLPALATQLQQLDPAANVPPTNTQRVLRALGVTLAGKPFSSYKAAAEPNPQILRLALNPPRELLLANLQTRWQAMQQNGVLNEVQTALNQIPDGAPGLQTVGIPQLGAYLKGQCTFAEAEAAYLTALRQYVKRQRTWLNTQYNAQFTAQITDPQPILQQIRAHLAA